MRKALATLFLFCALDAQAARRALLIGINDYTASHLKRGNAPPDREWNDLNGAVNDVKALRQTLSLLYGFADRDIVTLTDQRATRAAILHAIEQQLVQPAAKDDVLLFYFAGHGSQVRNSLSDEPDRLDESIVPADSRAGARDIRDKELRPLFNAIVDRGARLTIIFDNCHSASGARGLPPDVRIRGIKADPRDVADGTRYGERPEERGALVLSAAEDFGDAYELRDEQKAIHGAFSWALLRAMRDASGDESASETFLRARARLRSEITLQQPAMSGNAQARQTPLLGARAARRGSHATVFVEKVRRDGTVVLQGGLAHGLSAGSELRGSGDGEAAPRLRVTATIGPGRSEARLVSGQPPRSGAMLEVTAPRRVPDWLQLQTPPGGRWAYHLALRRVRTGELANDTLLGGERYDLLLQRTASDAQPRYVYVFVVDSEGRSVLLYPTLGSVENRLPGALPAPREIRLDARPFAVDAPYGIDTYYLLTTGEPLPDPWILEFDGVRKRAPESPSALDLLTRANWSIERSVYESVASAGPSKR